MPFVEVFVADPGGGEGQWHLGDLRAWRQHDDDRWTAQVSWSSAPGQRHLEIFEADRVRPFEEGLDGRA